MPRMVRDANLETRSARGRLKVQRKEFFRLIEPGLHLAYRKLPSGPGTWSVRRYIGDGKYAMQNLRTRDGKIIVADDYADADGVSVLTFAQAQAKAREAIRYQADSPDKLQTVSGAIDDYEADLRRRNADPYNARRVRTYLPASLGKMVVAKLAVRDFRAWSDGLEKAGLSPATINRTNGTFQAALNHAASQDERITIRPWDSALKSLPDATLARNVILKDSVVRGLVDSAYEAEGDDFGILVELAAVTGARPVQLRKLKVHHLQEHRKHPRLMMPSSMKGRGRKSSEERPVPIPPDLASRLARMAAGKNDNAPLLTKPTGSAWQQSEHTEPFGRVVEHYNARHRARLATEGEDKVTIYALRHSAIVRELLGGVATRVVAATHDTSVAMVEKHYARYITDVSDSVSRKTLLDMRRDVHAAAD